MKPFRFSLQLFLNHRYGEFSDMRNDSIFAGLRRRHLKSVGKISPRGQPLIQLVLVSFKRPSAQNHVPEISKVCYEPFPFKRPLKTSPITKSYAKIEPTLCSLPSSPGCVRILAHWTLGQTCKSCWQFLPTFRLMINAK